MGPAATALTRTPRGLYSAVQLCVSDARAALVAPYAAPLGKPIRPAMLLMLMMLPVPLAAIAGANAPTRKYAALTLLAKMASKSSTVVFSVGPQMENPALFTSTSMSPASKASRSMSVGLLRWAGREGALRRHR